METATIAIPEPILQRARSKAQKENTEIEQVVYDLLTRWIDGEIGLDVAKHSRDELVALARAARGMWSDRDPDEYLAKSRAGLQERDEELEHARLAA
jgi:hypothetical protein